MDKSEAVMLTVHQHTQYWADLDNFEAITPVQVSAILEAVKKRLAPNLVTMYGHGWTPGQPATRGTQIHARLTGAEKELTAGLTFFTDLHEPTTSLKVLQDSLAGAKDAGGTFGCVGHIFCFRHHVQFLAMDYAWVDVANLLDFSSEAMVWLKTEIDTFMGGESDAFMMAERERAITDLLGKLLAKAGKQADGADESSDDAVQAADAAADAAKTTLPAHAWERVALLRSRGLFTALCATTYYDTGISTQLRTQVEVMTKLIDIIMEGHCTQGGKHVQELIDKLSADGEPLAAVINFAPGGQHLKSEAKKIINMEASDTKYIADMTSASVALEPLVT